MEKKVIELEAQVGKAQKDLDGVAKSVKKIDNNLEEVKKTSSGVAKGVKGIGNALKAAGIGLAIAAFSKLVEVFNQNQKVTDAFNTSFEALSLAFNDFFNFLSDNVGTVIDYFKGLFENPVQSLKNFGQAIFDNVIERVKSALDALGFLGSAVVKVFEGDFAGAAESAKNAGKELLDVVTGVDNSFEKAAEILPTVVDGISKYTKTIVQAAQENVKLNKQAEIANVINQGLIEKYDRQAEQQRQLRDDETRTIDERIKSNEKLGEILEEQQKLMLENVDITIRAAQAEYNKNQNQENYIALLEAQNEREAVLAQIEGFRSEQILNRISLEKELTDQVKEKAEEEEEAAEKRKEQINDLLDASINAAGEETKIGKALFLAKQGIRIKEQIEEAKATLQRISLRASEASVDLAKGTASTAKVGFPQNIPLLIAFGIQAAGIISSVKSAVNAVKSSATSVGASDSFSSPSFEQPQTGSSQAPDFNVVGASDTNQLAQAIGSQQQQPVKAFVVSNDVTTAQGLERNIVEGASIG